MTTTCSSRSHSQPCPWACGGHLIGPGVALAWGSPPPSWQRSSHSCWSTTESTSELVFSADFARQHCLSTRTGNLNVCHSFYWNLMSPHMTVSSWFLVSTITKLCSFACHSAAEGQPSSGRNEVQLQMYPPTFSFLSKTVMTRNFLCLQDQLSVTLLRTGSKGSSSLG